MALGAGGAAGRLAPLLPLLLALLAVGSMNGSSAKAAEPLGRRAESGSGKVSECIQCFIKPCNITGALLKEEAGETGKAPDLLVTLVAESVGYGESRLTLYFNLNLMQLEPAILRLNATVFTEVEFGVCTVTCGIGIREVLLTSGCPGTEAKCIVGVEECRGPVDCGWGIPISEGLACVKMPCIYIPPENRFKYVWKMFFLNKTVHILPNDSAIMEACRDTHSVTFQCETQENGNVIASVKYTVYATTEMETEKSRRIETGQSRRKTIDAILVFCLVTGMIVTVGVIFAMIFMILHWAVVKSIWESRSGQDNQEKKMANKRSLL